MNRKEGEPRSENDLWRGSIVNPDKRRKDGVDFLCRVTLGSELPLVAIMRPSASRTGLGKLEIPLSGSSDDLVEALARENRRALRVSPNSFAIGPESATRDILSRLGLVKKGGVFKLKDGGRVLTRAEISVKPRGRFKKVSITIAYENDEPRTSQAFSSYPLKLYIRSAIVLRERLTEAIDGMAIEPVPPF
jgi:hypothetical protein